MSIRKSFPGAGRTVQMLCLLGAVLTLAACGAGSSSSTSSSSSSSASSTSSSSSSSGGDAVAGEALFTTWCVGCHQNNRDGSFGDSSATRFYVDSLRRTSLANLAQYIEVAMPQFDPSACVGTCATNVAAYLRTFAGLGGSSSSSSSSGGTDAIARGKTQFDGQCATCHAGPRVQGVFDYASLRAKGIYSNTKLRDYISASMPLGNPAACAGACADDVMAYISTWHMPPMDPATPTDPLPANRANQIDNPVVAFQCTQATSYGNRTLRLLTRAQYQNTVRDLFGVTTGFADLLPADSRSGLFVNNNNLTVLPTFYSQYISAADAVAKAALQNSGSPVPASCGNNYNQTCATNFINQFATRIFRRPLTEQERTIYNNIANGMQTNGDIKLGIERTLGVMLSSPQFLYRHEIGELNSALGSGVYALTAHEMAAFLSYSFANTTPSNDLLSAATNNQLGTVQQIRQWAATLLGQTEARNMMRTAVHTWLETDKLDTATKDSSLYPNAAQLYPAMKEELSLLFSSVMLDSGRSFRDLYAPGLTYVNSALSNHYGTGAPTQPNSQGYGYVMPTNRGGLLLSGAFLTLHGDSDEASPIRRAVNIRRDLLCQDFPPPPPGVDVGRTNKEGELKAFLEHPKTTNRMANHRMTEDGNCRICHAETINPLGFALEDYDTVGRFRTADRNNNPIDANGAVYSPNLQLQLFYDPERDMERYDVNGGSELALMLAEGELSGLAKTCLASQMVSLTTGLDYASILGATRSDVVRLPADEKQGYNCDVGDLVNTLSSSTPRAMLEQIGTLDTVRYRKAWTR
jgi:mono/diheme cytochrome c family protein